MHRRDRKGKDRKSGRGRCQFSQLGVEECVRSVVLGQKLQQCVMLCHARSQ